MNKNTEDVILLTLDQGERFSEKTRITIDILKKRLVLMGIENPFVIFDEHFIQVEIPGETDMNKFADLLCNRGKNEPDLWEEFPTNTEVENAIIKSGSFHKKLLVNNFKVIQNGQLVKQSAFLSPAQIDEYEKLLKNLQQHSDVITDAVESTTITVREKLILKSEIDQVFNQHLYKTIAERRLYTTELDQLITKLKKIEEQLSNPEGLKQLLSKITLYIY